MWRRAADMPALHTSPVASSKVSPALVPVCWLLVDVVAVALIACAWRLTRGRHAAAVVGGALHAMLRQR
jgi:hypothetical protein